MISSSIGPFQNFSCNHPAADVHTTIVDLIPHVVTRVTSEDLLKDLVRVLVLVLWDAYSQTEHAFGFIPAKGKNMHNMLPCILDILVQNTI